MEQRRTELLSKLFSHMKKTAGAAGLTKTGCLLRLFSASISNVFLYFGQNEPYTPLLQLKNIVVRETPSDESPFKICLGS